MKDDIKNQTPAPGNFAPCKSNSIMIPSKKRRPWSDVAMFENPSDGQLLEADLKNKGFETRTYNDKLLQLFLFLCPPHATIRVQVRGNDFKNAAYFLDHEPATSDLLKKAIRCPSCGSLRVQYPQMTRKFLLPTLLLHLGIIFRVIVHEAYCESCHWLWSLPKKRVSAPAKARAASAVSLE
jgi:hypothetical protein